MKKRVITSLVFGAIAIMVSSFLVLTPIFFLSFSSSETKKAYSDIHDNIEHVKPLVQMSLSFRTSKMDRLFNESMSQFAYFSKSNIIVCDKDGNMMWANGITNINDAREYTKKAANIMKEKRYLKTTGLLDKLYHGKTISVGEYIKNDAGADSWIVFCSRKAPDLAGQYKGAFLEILLIELITLSFVAVFMYLFSNNITGPLKKINNTLNEFSKGNFDVRVEYTKANEIGELASNINHMADSVGALEKMRQNFVSDISHELRTPMTSISGFIGGILDGTIPKEEHEKYLNIALMESRRLSRLVNELLQLTGIDEQVRDLVYTDFDIEELSKIVLLKFEDEITKKNISVSFDLEGEDFIVRADNDKLTQVLINLFHNAVKFTPEGGKISIHFKKKEQKCICTVKNTGYGIAADKMKFIWERFYKADNSRSSDRSGIGIGLYIVKKIIDAHDEKITVSSVPGESTSFTFTISLS